MTNKELEKKIEELSAQIEALKRELKETPKSEIWKPKKGQEYWYVMSSGETYHEVYFGGEEEIEVGNAYLTKKIAEFEAQREKYTRLFRQYVEQHSEPLDWKDDDQEKWYVCYDTDTDNISFEITVGIKRMDIYGSSKQVMQDAIDFVGEENVLRYILSVEE